MFLNSSTGVDIPIAELARLVCHALWRETSLDAPPAGTPR
ncbi:hypothetical protein ACVWYQ_003275 [Bradyrhizobium sp. USDA 3397]